MGELVRNLTATIAQWLRRRGPRRPQGASTAKPGISKEWADEWLGNDTPDDAMNHEWRSRWERTEAAASARRRRRFPEPAEAPELYGDPLAKYRGLRKHEASLLFQMRTGKIGLRSFLFYRKVPDVPTPRCSCGRGHETACHIVTECLNNKEDREALYKRVAPTALRSRRDFAAALNDPDTAAIVVRWFLRQERIPHFALATQIGGETGEQRLPRERAAWQPPKTNSARYIRIDVAAPPPPIFI
jgi:hypothetical protein